MRRDPDTGRFYLEATDLTGFHTRRGLPSIHLTKGGGRAVCGRVAETTIRPEEMPPFAEAGLCQACSERVLGGRPAIVRWWRKQRSKEGDNAR